jgi:hypothetical protein
VCGVCHFLLDIGEQKHAEEERRRMERSLRVLGGCNQVVIQAQEEGELLERVCRLVVERGGYF